MVTEPLTRADDGVNRYDLHHFVSLQHALAFHDVSEQADA